MSKRRHNFGTKRFKEKSLFIFHVRIALKSLILLFVRLIARGGRYGWTHTHTYTQDNYSNPRCACAPRVNKYCHPRVCAPRVNNYKRVREHAHLILSTCTSYVPIYAYLYCGYGTKEVSKCTVTSERSVFS